MTKSEALELIKQLNKWRQFLASKGDSDTESYKDCINLIADIVIEFKLVG